MEKNWYTYSYEIYILQVCKDIELIKKIDNKNKGILVCSFVPSTQLGFTTTTLLIYKCF